MTNNRNACLCGNPIPRSDAGAPLHRSGGDPVCERCWKLERPHQRGPDERGKPATKPPVAAGYAGTYRLCLGKTLQSKLGFQL